MAQDCTGSAWPGPRWIMRPYLFLTAIAIFFGLAGFFTFPVGWIGVALWAVAVVFAISAIAAYALRKKEKGTEAAVPPSPAPFQKEPQIKIR